MRKLEYTTYIFYLDIVSFCLHLVIGLLVKSELWDELQLSSWLLVVSSSELVSGCYFVSVTVCAILFQANTLSAGFKPTFTDSVVPYSRNFTPIYSLTSANSASLLLALKTSQTLLQKNGPFKRVKFVISVLQNEEGVEGRRGKDLRIRFSAMKSSWAISRVRMEL